MHMAIGLKRYAMKGVTYPHLFSYEWNWGKKELCTVDSVRVILSHMAYLHISVFQIEKRVGSLEDLG